MVLTWTFEAGTLTETLEVSGLLLSLGHTWKSFNKRSTRSSRRKGKTSIRPSIHGRADRSNKSSGDHHDASL